MGRPPNLISFSVWVTFKLVQVGPALFLRGVPQALSTAWLNPGIKTKKPVIRRMPLNPILSTSPYLSSPLLPPQLLPASACWAHADAHPALLWQPRQRLSPLGGPSLAQTLVQAARGTLRLRALLGVTLLHHYRQTYSRLLRSPSWHRGEDKLTEGHGVQGGGDRKEDAISHTHWLLLSFHC